MMDPSDIIRLLNTDHYAPANLEEVNDLCRNFPEFNLAHMLKVRIRESLGHQKEKELRVAAVYSSNREKLYQLVTGVIQPSVSATTSETPDEEPGGIQFSDAPYVHAEVIIEQHAPYAGAEADEDLLELEEDPEAGDSFILDSSEMEEAAPDKSDTPAIDTVKKEESPSKNNSIIQSFIKGEAGPIRADKKTSLKGDVSLQSIREHDGFITDTLAKIYVKQGLVAKAIYAYEKLSLKYPEKSAYFAAQIEKVKNINHS